MRPFSIIENDINIYTFMKTFQQYNESIRDKMTPISSELITKKLGKLNGYELSNYLTDIIYKRDETLLKLILKDVDMGRLSEYQLYDLIELSIDMNNINIVNLLLINKLHYRFLEKLYLHAMQCGYDHIANSIKEIIPIKESIRDKMTPKSEEDIKKTLKDKPIEYVLNLLPDIRMNINDIFTKEEIKDKLKDKSVLQVMHILHRIDSIDIDDIFTKEQQSEAKNQFSYIDEENEVIYVDIERMKGILSVVGERMDEIIVNSKEQYPKDYQNEIFITYWENAWGGISFEEWNYLDKRLKGIVNKNGLDGYYDIDTHRGSLTLKFDSDYPLEEI